jgi:hypothetical protein
MSDGVEPLVTIARGSNLTSERPDAAARSRGFRDSRAEMGVCPWILSNCRESADHPHCCGARGIFKIWVNRGALQLLQPAGLCRPLRLWALLTFSVDGPP